MRLSREALRSPWKLGAILGLGLAVGLTADTLINRPSDAAATPRSMSRPFPTNARGQTYGSIAGIVNPADDPTLVSVQDTKGQDGYVYASQFNGPIPHTLQQALAQKITPRTIPVYAVNGTTVIGKFVVGDGYTSNAPPPPPSATQVTH